MGLSTTSSCCCCSQPWLRLVRWCARRIRQSQGPGSGSRNSPASAAKESFMGFGAFTRYIDIPQVVLYLFWIFFVGLIWYLRGEDKREGYPLVRDFERPGSPQPPTGNPMLEAAGPASYVQRK